MKKPGVHPAVLAYVVILITILALIGIYLLFK